jgi:hypothetical protein
MTTIEALLRQKAYKELTDAEQKRVLQDMTAEEYEAERHIILLSEKLKLQDAEIHPSPTLRTQLSAHMGAKHRKTWVLPMAYRVAATVCICAIGIYFWQKNKGIDKRNTPTIANNINTSTHYIEPKVNEVNTTVPQPIIEKKARKKAFLKPKKQKNIDFEENILLTFNRKNPNMDWQTDDEEDEMQGNQNIVCPDK